MRWWLSLRAASRSVGRASSSRRLCRSPSGRQPKSNGDHLRRRCLHIMAGERIVRRPVACKEILRSTGVSVGAVGTRVAGNRTSLASVGTVGRYCRQARGRNRCDRGQACFQKLHVIALKLTERNAHIARNRGGREPWQRSGECNINGMQQGPPPRNSIPPVGCLRGQGAAGCRDVDRPACAGRAVGAALVGGSTYPALHSHSESGAVTSAADAPNTPTANPSRSTIAPGWR